MFSFGRIILQLISAKRRGRTRRDEPEMQRGIVSFNRLTAIRSRSLRLFPPLSAPLPFPHPLPRILRALPAEQLPQRHALQRSDEHYQWRALNVHRSFVTAPRASIELRVPPRVASCFIVPRENPIACPINALNRVSAATRSFDGTIVVVVAVRLSFSRARVILESRVTFNDVCITRGRLV